MSTTVRLPVSKRFFDASAVLPDHAAFQVRVATHGDVEATVAGNDATLFLHAAQVALDLLLADVDGAAAAIHEGAASLGLLAGVVVGVLLADDGQVAADA
ncbi:hypothetical protein NJG12_22500, partial [Stenotrophomonas maltophilia]